MFGDDQYENFKEDIVPPFAVLAYEDHDIQPWKHRRTPDNPWGEPVDTTSGCVAIARLRSTLRPG
jgi:hypothetical protein